MVVVEVSAVLLLSTVLAEGPNTQLGSSVICHGCCQPSSVPAPHPRRRSKIDHQSSFPVLYLAWSGQHRRIPAKTALGMLCSCEPGGAVTVTVIGWREQTYSTVQRRSDQQRASWWACCGSRECMRVTHSPTQQQGGGGQQVGD